MRAKSHVAIKGFLYLALCREKGAVTDSILGSRPGAKTPPPFLLLLHHHHRYFGGPPLDTTNYFLNKPPLPLFYTGILNRLPFTFVSWNFLGILCFYTYLKGEKLNNIWLPPSPSTKDPQPSIKQNSLTLLSGLFVLLPARFSTRLFGPTLQPDASYHFQSQVGGERAFLTSEGRYTRAAHFPSFVDCSLLSQQETRSKQACKERDLQKKTNNPNRPTKRNPLYKQI